MSPFLDPAAQRAHRRRNLVQSVALLTGLGAIVAAATLALWGPVGAVASALAIAAVYLLAPRVPPETVMRLYGAEPLPPGRAGSLSRIMDELARRAELATPPRLYVVPSSTLNAFATGTPRSSAIAVTEGLLRRLTQREIVGVLAHETSHIRNNDLHVMGLADILTRFAQTLSYVAVALAAVNLLALLNNDHPMPWWPIVLLYLAPALSSVLQLALSRTREFDADLEAAMMTGDPVGLASALRRLEHYIGAFWEDLLLPVPGRRIPQPSLLRSHPATEDRVRRLMALGGTAPLPPIAVAEEPMMSMVGWGPGTMRPRYRWPGVWY